MQDPSLNRMEAPSSYPSTVLTTSDYDDDDDAADDDYEDDDEGIVAPSHERWSSRDGFGSPEWWTGW
jgi:hypothetical protein